MSPTSQAQRKGNQKQLRHILKRKLERCDETEVPLDDQQCDEMSSVMSIIETEHPVELEKLFHEGKINSTSKS